MAHECLPSQGDDIIRSWTSSLACRALERRIAHTGTNSELERQWTATTEEIYLWMDRRHDATVRVLSCLLFMESRTAYLNATLERRGFSSQVHHQIQRLCLDALASSSSKEVIFVASIMKKVADGELPCLSDVLELGVHITSNAGCELTDLWGVGHCDTNEKWRKRSREEIQHDTVAAAHFFSECDKHESVLPGDRSPDLSPPFSVVSLEERLRKSFKQEESRQHSCFTSQTNQGVISEPAWTQWESESPPSSSESEEELPGSSPEDDRSTYIPTIEVKESVKVNEEVAPPRTEETPSEKEGITATVSSPLVQVQSSKIDSPPPPAQTERTTVPSTSNRRPSALSIVKSLDGVPMKSSEEMRVLLTETWKNLTPTLREAFMLAVDAADVAPPPAEAP